MSYAKRRGKKHRDTIPFVRIAKDMLVHCKEWKELSAAAKLLYQYIKTKYNGSNNGEIKLTYSELKGIKGISSPGTISKAQEELVKAEWIKITQHGGLYRYFNLYKLTWKYDPLD